MQGHTILVFTSGILEKCADVVASLATDTTDSVGLLLHLLNCATMGNELRWIPTESSVSRLWLFGRNGT